MYDLQTLPLQFPSQTKINEKVNQFEIALPKNGETKKIKKHEKLCQKVEKNKNAEIKRAKF